jgi:hypothetical protein
VNQTVSVCPSRSWKIREALRDRACAALCRFRLVKE